MIILRSPKKPKTIARRHQEKKSPLIANRKCICQNPSFATTKIIKLFLRKKKSSLGKLVTDQFVTDIFFTIMFLPSEIRQIFPFPSCSLLTIFLHFFAPEMKSKAKSRLPQASLPIQVSRGGETNEWKKLKIRASSGNVQLDKKNKSRSLENC